MTHFELLLERAVLILLILLGLMQSGESVVYYINPSQDNHCPTDVQPCLNLSQLPANPTNESDINITLIMLPGDHSLVTNISFSNFKRLEMYSDDFNVAVKCKSSSHFSFESIELVSVRRMTFIGCGNSLVRNIDQVFLQGTRFEGLPGTGTSLTLINSTAEIVDCTFVGNQFGTVMESVESLNLITTTLTWLIVRNVTGIVRVGGALISTHSNVSISHSRFDNNTAEIGGDIFAEKDNTISILNSTFTGDGPQPFSEESPFGGAIFSHRNNLSIVECQFHNKHATVGASVMSSSTNITTNRSSFNSNSATDHAGGIFIFNSTVFIYRSYFDNNTALGGAAVTTELGVITVAESVFTFNRASQHGGALDIGMNVVTISGCHFEGNVANSFAGAVLLWGATSEIYGRITQGETLQTCDQSCDQEAVDTNGPLESSLGNRTQFISNSAPTGAALHVIKGTLKSCGPIYFSKNSATLNSNVYFLNSDGHFMGSIELTKNIGSFFAFNSNITFSGCTKFLNCSPPGNTTVNFKEGGALTLYQTTLRLQGEARFEYNRAEIGGAIVATESEIYLSDQVYVTNNSASTSGGGLYLSQSELLGLQESTLTISSNNAHEKGGGIYAVSSSIKSIVTGSQHTDPSGKMTEQYKGAILNMTKNEADFGGAIYLEANSKITVLKDYIFETDMKRNAVNIVGNSANYGGAIYVDDETNSGSCVSNPFEIKSPKSECFISVVSTQTIVTSNTNFSLSNILFGSNTATISGATLFGGMLDRCIVSPFNEVDRTIDQATNKLLRYEGGGLKYFMDISNEKNTQSISSYAVKVCPCVNGRQNCSYKIQGYVEVKKGTLFNVSLVAVDQVYKPISAVIQGSLYAASQSNLLYGQVTKISDRCTNMSFQITSVRPSEELILFADGPCKNAELSTLKVSVSFLPCTCPIGFTPSDAFSDILCLCVCDPQISPYVAECNSTTQSFRRAINVWISYINNSNSSGYLVHKYCPFDYCIPPNMSEPINLNKPNGANAQCALNRTGMLCGACKPGLSLSLGSSKCLKCPSYWPALFASITIFAILAGIGLIILFLWFNITVAVGTLNGLLFYVNIVAANRVVLLPYPEPNFITVFISWLNLELGIDVCYIDGMDTYMKTWLQLAFPIYIIFLVVLLIIVSRYSSRFSNLIARRNPVATLATLILISYGKLFHVVLLAQPFSYAILNYPGGTKNVLWLPDGTISYLNGKHIVLFIVALLILAFCIVYSFLLLCWQLILHVPDWKIFRCIKSPTFNLFMEAYHAPYTPKHRYWTGLLLLARAIIYLIATANVSGDPQIQLISVIFILSCVILLKMFIATKIFKKWLIDSLESFFYFNTIFLASFTAYNLSTGNNQDGVAYTSVILSIMVTILVLLYHVYAYTSLFTGLRNNKCVAYFKNWMTSTESDTNEDGRHSITDYSNSIRRHDDILDITNPLTSDAEYHNPDYRSVENRQQRLPTISVVELD